MAEQGFHKPCVLGSNPSVAKMKPSDNYISLLEEIEKLKSTYHINYDIQVVVVTKYASLEQIVELLRNSPVKHIGENRVQEAEKRFLYLENLGLINNVKKHMLGPIQSNKINKVVKNFDFIHSIEDVEVPEGLMKRNFSGELLMEVKTSYESTKHGVEVEKALDLFGEIHHKNIKISGLMTIAPFTDNEYVISKCFETLRKLKEEIEKQYNVKLTYLSMGMSNDYKIAIKEGANMLRIGNLIFRE